MAQVNFTIPDAEVPRVINTLKWLFPIPTDEEGEPLFTDQAWAKESIRRWIVSQVKRYEEMKAKEAVNIISDNSIIS